MSLKVEHVNRWFGQFQVIQDLSMEVEQGALFGFLGPNGAGKTTTMRMILDIFRPDAGRITWNGTPVSEVTRRNWGYLPEERGLYPKTEPIPPKTPRHTPGRGTRSSVSRVKGMLMSLFFDRPSQAAHKVVLKCKKDY
jgi:energy-coupling factor transporter ATP-binding protein EcfA2